MITISFSIVYHPICTCCHNSLLSIDSENVKQYWRYVFVHNECHLYVNGIVRMDYVNARCQQLAEAVCGNVL